MKSLKKSINYAKAWEKVKNYRNLFFVPEVDDRKSPESSWHSHERKKRFKSTFENVLTWRALKKTSRSSTCRKKPAVDRCKNFSSGSPITKREKKSSIEKNVLKRLQRWRTMPWFNDCLSVANARDCMQRGQREKRLRLHASRRVAYRLCFILILVYSKTSTGYPDAV